MLSFTFESIHHSSRKLCYLSLLRVYIFSLKNILCTRGYIQLDIILNFSKYIYISRVQALAMYRKMLLSLNHLHCRCFGLHDDEEDPAE